MQYIELQCFISKHIHLFISKKIYNTRWVCHIALRINTMLIIQIKEERVEDLGIILISAKWLVIENVIFLRCAAT